ncbi:hypothetical protein LEP1GSC062_0324 [Leptospira alexanderi serovar Manhao 3 str. L 60]|uniref:Uncharacterized protein n=1 Tax=Leptospira alexanderi serovar Manhao 3 str. L 60 TaxID=1049759 RepID=V6I576_9LEPT|nr:hypothetical protein LEP1GSC062_0324 [Leptospira alexanderi serovar Manhao 3 str. L 60]
MLSRIDLEKAFLDRWKMLLFLMQEIFDIANKKFNKLKKRFISPKCVRTFCLVF